VESRYIRPHPAPTGGCALDLPRRLLPRHLLDARRARGRLVRLRGARAARRRV